ncbi:hypothetical protein SELR_18270 [Selenomonas ruminantium subsp. lactilytica TAM6421]|uniref:Uncharacterized protein n=2 Tax=Selenomonas ruminantium TaxID=971 RepID=I0GRZ8_SELRL|nr:hypothetical protein SELR_18270 [Selenomonas ruminantium subsp. lactilytica TAM6421]
MEKNKRFQVYIISSSRYEWGMVTAKNFLDYKHVIRKSQVELYKEHGFDNIVGIDDELINSYTKVYNYIVDNAPEDVVAIVDDDIDHFIYRTKEVEDITDKEVVQAEFERLAQIIYDLDLGLAFGPPNAIPYNYTSEFAWMGIPGAWKIVNRKYIKARMDAKIDRNVDIDYVLQEVLNNRVCIDAKYLCDVAHKDKLTNTTGSLYSKTDIDNSIDMMKLRWGKYFQYDAKKNIPKIRVKR